MGRAVIIGGTGAIGRATARRLLAAGWSVDLIGRNPARMPRDIAAAGGRFIPAGRADRGQVQARGGRRASGGRRAGGGRLEAAFGDGADLLVDCASYTAQGRGPLAGGPVGRRRMRS